MALEVQRIAAFSEGGRGGNPAGVVLTDASPSAETMQRIAAEIGYSETAFATPQDAGWRIRYFAPATEVSFCGHATIATGAALGARRGPGTYPLILNDAEITVDAFQEGGGGGDGDGGGSADSWSAALQSPPTRTGPPPPQLEALLAAFAIEQSDLDAEFPVRIAEAGARHLVVMVTERARLAAMQYPFEPVKALMTAAALDTISLLWRETDTRFHARNAFAVGGVVEDPATGAAAAAFAGYLREFERLPRGDFEIIQGEDMGARSRLVASATNQAGASVRVSGATRIIGPPQRFTMT